MPMIPSGILEMNTRDQRALVVAEIEAAGSPPSPMDLERGVKAIIFAGHVIVRVYAKYRAHAVDNLPPSVISLLDAMAAVWPVIETLNVVGPT